MANVMAIKIFFSGETFTTFCALKWSVLFVDITGMHLKSSLSVKDLSAELAFESILSRVIEEVCLETSRLYELLSTIRTLMGTDSGMDSHMSVESAFE